MREFIHFYTGYLKIEIKDGSRERFLNLLLIHKIKIWGLEKNENRYVFFISINDFKKLSEFVRKTRVRVHILEKHGFPFHVNRIVENASFYIGCILAAAFISWSMGNINAIEFSGNIHITNDQLNDFLCENQLKVGKRINQFSMERLEEELLIRYPDIIWTSMEIDGTVLKVAIKELENTGDKTANEDIPSGDLVSEYNGTIYSIITRRGTPLVKAGDSVSCGDILVSGIIPVYDDGQNVKEFEYVKADADVIIEHDMDISIKVPKTINEKQYTGRKHEDICLTANQRKIVLRFFNQPFLYQDTYSETLKWNETFTPFGANLSSIEYREYYFVERKISSKEAKQQLVYELINFILSLEDKGVQIIEKNVKIINDTDLFYLGGYITVLENSEYVCPISNP